MHADADRPPPVNVTSVNATPPEVDKTPAKIWRDGKLLALFDREAAGPPSGLKRPGAESLSENSEPLTPGPSPARGEGSIRKGAKQPGVFLGRDLRRGFARSGVQSDWSAPEPEPQPAGLMVVDWACDVTEAATSWLWPGRIPLGRLTLLAAHDPRDASLVAMDLTARLSRGALWPDDLGSDEIGPESLEPDEPARGLDSAPGETGPGATGPGATSSAASTMETVRVLYLAPHRERATRCIPGLRQAGAQMERLLCLDGMLTTAGKEGSDPKIAWRPLQLPADISSLRRALRDLPAVQLIVLDPIEAFFDTQGNSKTPQRAGELLRELAWDFGLAVVAVTRLKRMAAGRRAVPEIDSQALAGVASAGWGILPSGRSERQQLLLPVQFELDGAGPALMFERQADPQAAPIRWDSGHFEMTAADFEEGKNAGIKFAIAAAWLKSLLSQGPRLKRDVKKQALQLGISPNMLRNVYAALRIKTDKSGYQGGGAWQLPPGAMAGPDAEGDATSGAADESLDATETEHAPEALTNGECPSRMEETPRISIGEGCAAPPHE